MTEREQFQIAETKEACFIRDLFNCQYPGCTEPAMHLAHRIAQSKVNLRLYGKDVIHHPMNMVSVCTHSRHNDHFNIGNNPGKVQELLNKIEEARG